MRSKPRRGLLLAAALVLASPLAVAGDEVESQLVVIPGPCLPYWLAANEPAPRAAWDALLSLASCIQDGSIPEATEDLPALVDEMRSALVPAIELLVAVFERGPGPVKIRAAYQLALSQVALITRARAAIRGASDVRRARLEALLQPAAERAYILFAAVDRAVSADAELAPDAVTRGMARSARVYLAQLRATWSFPRQPLYLER